MKALACPILAYEYLNSCEKADSSQPPDNFRNEPVLTGSSGLWYNIGFGLGLALGRSNRELLSCTR